MATSWSDMSGRNVICTDYISDGSHVFALYWIAGGVGTSTKLAIASGRAVLSDVALRDAVMALLTSRLNVVLYGQRFV